MSDEPEPVLIEEIIADPETAISYFAAVSKTNETIGTTLSLDEFTYQQNVGLTAAALLDGYQRHQMLDTEQSTSDFLNDVIEDMKQRNENKVSEAASSPRER